MRSFFPIVFAAVVILVLGFAEVLLLRLLNQPWWNKKSIRRASLGLPLFGAVMVTLWAWGVYHSVGWLSLGAAVAVALAMVLEFALMLSLPVSGIIHQVMRLIDYWVKRRRAGERDRPVDEHRRLFLKGAAAAVPAVTVGMAVTGVGWAFASPKVFRHPISISRLPSPLEGFRILQLSDLHLGRYVTLDHLVDVIGRVREYKPRMVMVTGDVADDLDLLPDALDLIAGIGAPLGAFACLGNHEYFRGIQQVRRIFADSPVRLLINEGVRVFLDGVTLFIGGVDDPRVMGESHDRFFESTIGITLQERVGDDFTLLMSHRPDALNEASLRNIRLTLSGHTHGGQIGVFGRSLFENYSPESYLWGDYQRGESHLYTTAGFGHWFPFRLGCPAEAPIIELVSD